MGRALVVVVLTVGAFSIPAAPQASAADLTYSSEHFSITWSNDPASGDAPNLDDADADGIPDSVERVVEAFERARAFEIDALGYLAPPVDDSYPLYVAFAGGGGGYTRLAPGGNGESRPSYTVVPPDLFRATTPQISIDIFAAHEYFHAIQNGYNAHAEDWVAEATATWVAALYNNFDPRALGSLRGFVPYPRLGLSAGNGIHEYGAFTFFEFLAESLTGSFDPAVVRELWEAMASPDAIPSAPMLGAEAAIVQVVDSHGRSLPDAWTSFVQWEWQLTRYAHSAAYRAALSGVAWPRVSSLTRVKKDSCRLSAGDPPGGLPPLSSDYLGLVSGPHSAVRSSLLTVVGTPSTVASMFVRSDEGTVTEQTLKFDVDGVARAELSFGGDARRITLAVGNVATTGPPAPLAYSLRSVDSRATEVPPPAGVSATTYGTAVTLSGSISCNGAPVPFVHATLTQTDAVSGEAVVYEVVTDPAGNWRRQVAPQSNQIYSVAVDDPLLSRAESPPKPVAVRLRVVQQPSSDRIVLGEPISVSGTVDPVHPSASVVIEFRRPERDWRSGAQAIVDESGTFEGSFVLPAAGIWEVRSRVTDTGDADHVPGTNPPALVAVRRNP
ncbi:MAG TPA: hypothetical protein VFK89_05005 [Actinomycetota bacterium]|nr:hypothetical protein [Actinomycetota bacterium]